MVVLEPLTPPERLAFVLHDVFVVVDDRIVALDVLADPAVLPTLDVVVLERAPTQDRPALQHRSGKSRVLVVAEPPRRRPARGSGRMHARSTVLRAMPESLDDGMAAVRDRVVPALQEMEGFAGYSLLLDRASGRCIVTTAWRDEASLADSRERVLDLRREAAERFGDTEPEVREWEVATMHRDHPTGGGACARVTWLRVPTDRVDRQIEVFRSTVLPRLEELPGFCSASLLVDRKEGRAVGAVAYDSREALAATRQATMRIRTEAVEAAGAELMDVAEFEVALAHLRVPELV